MYIIKEQKQFVNTVLREFYIFLDYFHVFYRERINSHMIAYKMHLIRAGKTGAAAERRCVGRADIPLSAEGIAELGEQRRGFRYPPVGAVFSSPLRRCVQTAEILYPSSQIALDDGLMDMGLGSFEGRTFDELSGDEDFARWLENSLENTPPGGEEITEFTARIVNCARGIFLRMMDERLTSVAAVTHSGVIMTLLAAIGLPKLPLHEWATDNGCGYTLLFTPQMWMRDGCAEVFRRLPE